jgi:hypothetical protein
VRNLQIPLMSDGKYCRFTLRGVERQDLLASAKLTSGQTFCQLKGLPDETMMNLGKATGLGLQ